MTTAFPATRRSTAHTAERQLLEILLVEPGFVPIAIGAGVTTEAFTHAGLRRILTEVYATHAEADVEAALRERFGERSDLIEVTCKLRSIGHLMQDRAEWFGRILNHFTERRLAALRAEVLQILRASPRATLQQADHVGGAHGGPEVPPA